MYAKEIGTLIRKKRKEKGLSQSKLAAFLHVTTTAVSKWERGINYPDIQNLKLLSETLDISPMKLLPEDLQPLFLETALDIEVHDTQSSDTVTPEAQEPDTVTPEVQISDTEASETLEPDTVTPEVQISDTEASETLEPDTVTPEVQSSDAEAPKMPEPDTETPEVQSSDAETPEVPDPDPVTPETDNALPVPDNDATPEPTSPPSEPLKKKVYWKAIAISFLCIILLGSIAIAYWMKAKTPSFTIIDEYYDDYEGQVAYYILTEYTGEATDEDYNQYDNKMHVTYTNYFEKAAFIIVIYYKNGTYNKNAVDPFADAAAYTFLYPQAIYNTLKGDD